MLKQTTKLVTALAYAFIIYALVYVLLVASGAQY